MRLIAIAALSIAVCAVAHGTDLPCSIEQVRSTDTGVAIRFSQKMGWHYEDSLGHYGLIGVGGVTEFVVLPNGVVDILPHQAELQLSSGTHLKVYEYHTNCLIEFEGEGRRALKITYSFNLFGKSTTEAHKIPFD
jgi:hypothetical protein